MFIDFSSSSAAQRRLNRRIAGRSFRDLFDNLCDIFRQIFNMVCIFSVIAWTAPLFFFIVPPLTLIYSKIFVYFIKSSRELKRLDSVNRSPVYSHFAESLNGATTIRAFGDVARFNGICVANLDKNVRCLLLSTVIQYWLQVRTQGIMGALVLGITAGLCVFSGMPPSRAGVAIKYAMQLGWCLAWLVKACTSVETQMVSIERILEFAGIAPEPSLGPNVRPADAVSVPADWCAAPGKQLQLNSVMISGCCCCCCC